METRYWLAARERLGQPCLITVAEVPESLRTRMPFLLRVEFPYNARPNGLPAGDELRRVCDLESTVIKELERFGAVHLGHITFGGRMITALASPSPGPAFVEVRTGLLRREKLRVETAGDTQWQWYRANMELTPIEIETDHNRALLAKLAEYGDVPEFPRQVDFTVFFRKEADRAEFVRRVEPLGFSVHENGIWTNEGEAIPFGLVTSIVSPIEATVIAFLCAQIRQLAHRLEGEFDGWACPVQTSNTRHPGA